MLAWFLATLVVLLSTLLCLEKLSSFQRRERQHRLSSLLHSVFPKHISDLLSDGLKVPPTHFQCVTVFFSDIVGFTDLASFMHPVKVVELLDRLYDKFDEIADRHGLFKVETIGDSYMVAGAINDGQYTDHAARVAAFAVEALRAAETTLIDPATDALGFVQIRGGFHCGPVLGGVVGRSTPRFCLFGDTVNVAARMEHHSDVGRITVSNEAATLLRFQSTACKLIPRGVVEVKGKGPMQLWWLHPPSADTPSSSASSEPWTSVRRSNSQIWRRKSDIHTASSAPTTPPPHYRGATSLPCLRVPKASTPVWNILTPKQT